MITKRSTGEFQFNLKAANGQIILASEGYTTRAACENGIESVRRNSLDDSRFERLTSRNGKFYFLLKATNGQSIGSSELYESEASRDNGIDSVKRNALEADLEVAFDEPPKNLRSGSGQTSNLDKSQVKTSGLDWQNELAFESFQRFFTDQKLSERLLEIVQREREFKDSAQRGGSGKGVPDLATNLQEIQSLRESFSVEQRIPPSAFQELQSNKAFREAFANNAEMKAVVVSIDIRRSTELMLKSRTPKQYAEFITSLSAKLSHVITSNFGIYDKFTGDGILAFFPDFYSGDDSIRHALNACDECHRVFSEHYHTFKSIFTVFLKNIGLGIGIDYGDVTLVNRGTELTVVGVPVVYACRMSSAPPHSTWLNLPAFELLIDNCGAIVHYEEVEINLKHEGPALAYAVKFSKNQDKKLLLPKWTTHKNNGSIEGESSTDAD